MAESSGQKIPERFSEAIGSRVKFYRQLPLQMAGAAPGGRNQVPSSRIAWPLLSGKTALQKQFVESGPVKSRGSQCWSRQLKSSNSRRLRQGTFYMQRRVRRKCRAGLVAVRRRRFQLQPQKLAFLHSIVISAEALLSALHSAVSLFVNPPRLTGINGDFVAIKAWSTGSRTRE